MLNKLNENPRPLLAGLLIGHILLGMINSVLIQLLNGRIYAENILAGISNILPGILLLVHLFACCGKKRTQLLPPIGLIWGALLELLSIALFAGSIIFYDVILSFCFILAYIFLAVDALNGYRWRHISTWVIAAIIGWSVVNVISLFSSVFFMGEPMVYLVMLCAGRISSLCWRLALLVFWQCVAPLTAQQVRKKLIKLNEAYENQRITWDAYQSRKAALLRRL